MIEHRFRRTWFPDEQVAPERVLGALKARRTLAVTDPSAIPWMSAPDIGLALGVMRDQRWAPPGRPLEDFTSPTKCHRCTPNGIYWHPVAARDIRAALNHYEAEGVIVRLPNPLARWCVHFWPMDAADREAVVKAWLAMEEAREESRHAQKVRRLAIGRIAATGAA